MSKLSRNDIAKGFVSQVDSLGLKAACRQLAALLLQEHRHGEVDEVIDGIARQYAKAHGVVEATARTAYELSDETKKMLINRVKRETKAQTVILHEEIDRALLGGVILTAPDMELDLSLKTKLTKLGA